MTRMVHCIKLGKEAEGLAFQVYPGELGKKIFDNVSKEAWADWIKLQTMLVNENRLNLADARARDYLKRQMENHFFGAGAEQNEPVLSSGTWEILMVRSAQVDTSLLSQYAGSTCELDSQAGLYNPGMQWLASGVLEWVRKLFWTAETPWQMLIEEARLIAPGADGVKMQCDLLSCQNAGWQGVTLNTTRGHFYRAALEGLTAQLQRNLQMLEKIGHFKASELLLVGGGSRNTLWNQIKANMLDIPVKVLDDAETTVAGAALFGWYGVGEFNSPEEARAQIHYQYRYFYPQTEPEFIEEV